MADAGNGSVQLLEADPELARGLDPRRVREVSQRLFARAIDVPRGTWSPGRALSGGSQPIGLLVLEGAFRDGKMVLIGDRASRRDPKVTVRNRITWTPLARDTVRQLWDASTDGGRTWAVQFDGRYVRRP